MADSKEFDRKFEEIEDKLKNSFLGIKRDFELIDTKLKNSILTIKEDIQTINKKQDELEKAYSDTKNLKKQLPEIAEALKQNSELKEAIKDLKEEIKKQDQKQTKILEEYKETLEEQNARNEAITFKFKKLKKQLPETAEILEQNSELKESIEGLKERINVQNKILEQQNTKAETTESELKDLKKQLLEIAEVLKQNREFKDIIFYLKEEIKKQDKRQTRILEEQNEREDTTESELKDLKKQLLETTAVFEQNLRFKDNLESLKERINAQNKILEGQNNRNEVIDSELKDLKKKLESILKKKAPEEEIKKVSKFKRIKMSRLLIFLIPVAIIFYLIFMNMAPFGYEKTTFYDIGTGNSILTPKDRVSGNIVENGTSFQNLKDDLVYFDINPLWNTQQIEVELRFKDNFPKNSKGNVFSLCAKDQEKWHYKCNPVYVYTKNQGGWVTAKTTFNIKADNLYIKDGKLNMMLSIPHLDQKQYINNTIPLDYIKVTLIK